VLAFDELVVLTTGGFDVVKVVGGNAVVGLVEVVVVVVEVVYKNAMYLTPIEVGRSQPFESFLVCPPKSRTSPGCSLFHA